MRCIYESNNNLHSLKNYKESDIFGAEHILSDIQEQTLISSTSVNLEIPFAAMLVIYDSEVSVSMVHGYTRTYSTHEVEEEKTGCIMEQEDGEG